MKAIERITRGTAIAAGVPDDRLPIIKISETEFTTATYNEPKLTERLAAVFVKTFGQENVVKVPPVMGSEDFGYFGLDQTIPTTMFSLGAVDPAKAKASREGGAPLPSLHSPLFAPVPDKTISTGVRAMTSAVLDLMKR